MAGGVAEPVAATDAAPERSRAGPTRLVSAPGPLQALMAASAIRHLERSGTAPMRNVLVLGDLFEFDDGSEVMRRRHAQLREATLACARGIDTVIDVDGVDGPAELRERLGPGARVEQVLCMRNWGLRADLLALETFPEARRMVYGDGLGLLDVDRIPGNPRFHVAVPVIPQPVTRDTLKGIELDVVARDALVDVLESVRASDPALRAADAELAGFGRGGVLILTSYLSEIGLGTTVRGELRMAYSMVKRSAPDRCPVVIKPHPRATLGQAAALARRLRRDGHPVRILGPELYGHYPIELFSELARAVDIVLPGASSAALSLLYVHGVRPLVDVPPHLALRHVAAYQVIPFMAACADYAAQVHSLDRWDGRSPLPPSPQRSPEAQAAAKQVGAARWARFGGLRSRLRWVPADRLPAREVAWSDRPRLAVRGRGPRTFPDRDARLYWVAPPSLEGAMREATAAPGAGDRSATDRVLATLERLAGEAPGSVVAVVAAVRPSTHVPAWRVPALERGGVPLVRDAVFTAEELEEVLEGAADVLRRVPEPAGLARGVNTSVLLPGTLMVNVPEGHVAYVVQVRSVVPNAPRYG
jgi:hypothetical protein